MSRPWRRRALLASAVLALPAAAVPAAAVARTVPTGPAGTAFYTPPSPLPGEVHGDLIRARRLTGPAALPGAARTDLVLYRSTGVTGKPVAVSGTVSIPKGRAPKGGWPVITWAHGTTGIADACAPSRYAGNDGTVGPVKYAYPLLTRWLKAGWAVVRTDYEGLGTPGPHPYLVGSSEGRSTLDIVRAAHQEDSRISEHEVIISGHSQGGHAALWADSLSRSYAPELTVKGTVAFAPESHTGEQAALLSVLKDPSGLTGLAALILRGVEIQAPALHIASLLGDEAAPLYPLTDTACLPGLTSPSTFGAIAPADLLRSDADTTAVVAALNANDSEDVTIHGPLRIEQGDADTTVMPVFTDETVDEYEKKGYKPVYDVRKGVDHGGIVDAGAAAATAWIRRELAR